MPAAAQKRRHKSRMTRHARAGFLQPRAARKNVSRIAAASIGEKAFGTGKRMAFMCEAILSLAAAARAPSQVAALPARDVCVAGYNFAGNLNAGNVGGRFAAAGKGPCAA